MFVAVRPTLVEKSLLRYRRRNQYQVLPGGRPFHAMFAMSRTTDTASRTRGIITNWFWRIFRIL